MSDRPSCEQSGPKAADRRGLPPGQVREHPRVRLGAPRAGLCLLAIVLASAAARFVISLTFHAPWVAPDEMVYGLLGESLWSDGALTVRGEHVGYYSLAYPALVGGPLSLFGLPSGLVVLKALQALVMSAVAIPVYVWGRRLMSPSMALVAAGLCVLVPAMAYSGLIMSESLYYPLVTAALVALGFAVERPTTFRLALLAGLVTLAAAVRLQALVLVPTFAVALVLDACMARDVRRIRLFSAITAGAVVLSGLAGIAMVGDSSWSEALGAYGSVGASRPAPGAVAGGFVESVGGVALMSLLIPFLATALLAVTAFAHGEQRRTASRVPGDGRVVSRLSLPGGRILRSDLRRLPAGAIPDHDAACCSFWGSASGWPGAHRGRLASSSRSCALRSSLSRRSPPTSCSPRSVRTISSRRCHSATSPTAPESARRGRESSV